MKSSKITNTLLLLSLILFSLLESSSITCLSKKIKKTNSNSKGIEDDYLKKILKEEYPTFVKNLGENIKDEKFRAAIRSLSSRNKVNSKMLNATVANLLPTQNEIDVDKSLKFPLTSASSARSYLFCKEPIRIAGNTIITSDNTKYVVDGHHRWSQVYSINPNCEMVALDLTDIKDPINALKSTQLGIAAGQDKNGNDITEIPVSIVKGMNLLKISEADLKAYVIKLVKDNVVAVFNEFDAAIVSKEKVADYIWNNVARMQKKNQPVAGAPGRGLMPQTDMAVNWVANAVNTDKVLRRSKFLW